MTVAIFYATREGRTRIIAEHVAALLKRRGLAVDLQDVAALSAPVDWVRYSAAVVAASVHLGRHEREMIEFVKTSRRELGQLDAAFLSVSLSEAGAENTALSPDQREQAAADVRQMVNRFVDDTGWRPGHVLPVAGALAYSHYNVFIRFVMKQIARKAGAPTDTSHDYEFTDWQTLDRFVSDVVDAALRPPTFLSASGRS